MKVAFLVLCHNEPRIADLLLDQIGKSDYCSAFVHVDLKNESLYNYLRNHKGIFLADNRFNVSWGDVSIVNATLLLLRQAFESRYEFDYFCLLSGQDLIVRSGLLNFLKKNETLSFLNYSKDLNLCRNAFIRFPWPKFLKRNVSKAHPARLGRRLVISLYRSRMIPLVSKYGFLGNCTLWCGSAWWTLHRNVVESLLLYKFQDFAGFYSNALMPDERIFHTYLLNEFEESKFLNDNLLYFEFLENSPKLLGPTDLDRVRSSGAFFARKFSWEASGESLSLLEDVVL